MTLITAEEVGKYLRFTETLTEDTSPKLSEINALIEMATDIIEDRLKTAYSKKTITEEYYINVYDTTTNFYSVTPIHQPLRSYISAENKVELWSGSEYTTVPNDEFNFDNVDGRIYLKRQGKYRLTYSYGLDSAPAQVKRITLMQVGIDLISTSGNRSDIPMANSDKIDKQLEMWNNEIDTTIDRLTRFVVV